MLATPAIHIGHGVIEFPPAIVAGIAYVAVGTDAWLVGRQDLYGYPGEAV